MKKLLLCLLLFCSPALAQNNARMLGTPNAQTGTSYTFVAQDTARVTTFNNASPVAVTLPNGASQGFGGGTVLTVGNLGAGTVTITCSACTINGVGTFQLTQNQGVDIYGGFGTPAVNYVAIINNTAANAAIKPAASDAVQFIGVGGSDSNDGLSMGTAKGNADLGVAVAAAQTAIGSNPGTIYILPAAYNLSTAIKCVSNITITGYGAVVTSTVTGSSLVCANTFRAGVFGLRFIGPATTGSSVGLQLGINSGGTGSPTEWNTFKDLWFSNFHIGIDGQGSSSGNGTFYNTLINISANADGIGWHLIPGTSNFLNDNTIVSGFSAGNTSDGWEIDGANGNAILNGESETNGGCGVNFVGNNSTQGNTFSGGWLEANTTADVCTGSSTNVQFNSFLGTNFQSATPFNTLTLLQSGHNIIQPGDANSTAKDFYANALEATSLFLLSSGGGTITHQAPNTAGTFTITDPAATGTAPVFTGTITPGDCLKSGTAVTIVDAGGCASGNATGLLFGATPIPMSATAPTANQCLAADGTAANIIGVTCGAGGGNVSTSGSPLNHQYAIFSPDSTHITGVTPGTSGLPLVSNGTAADPSAQALPVASLVAPSTAGDTVCGNSTPAWADCVPGVAPRTVSAGPDTIVAGDRLNLIVSTSSTAVAASIASAASLGNNFTTKVCVQGAGTYTITPTTSTINGGSSYAITEGHCAQVISDNTNYTAYATNGLLSTDSTLTVTPSAFGNQLALAATSLPFGGGLGTSFQDVTETAAPGNPAAGNDRLYADSTSHTVKCLTSSGGSCLAAGGGTTWDAIGNPLGNLSLTMGADTSTLTYNATTGAGVNLFTLTDTTNNTGTGNLFRVGTAAGSAASPMQLFATGSASGTFTNGVAEDITNVTAATSSQEQPSPIFQLSGNIWNGTVTTKDTVTSQITYSGATNPAVVWLLGHAGSTSTSFNLEGPSGMTLNISPNAGTGPNIALGSGTNGILTITNSGTGNTVVKGSATASDVVGIFRSGNASPTGDVAQFQSSGSAVEASVGPSGIIQTAGTQIISAADYTNSTVTPSTVFSWTLPPTAAAKTYRYACTITWESTNTTLVGPVFGLNISAAPTQLTGTGYVKSALNSITNAEAEGYLSNATTGSQTLVTGNAAAITSTNYEAKIWGTIEGAPTAGSTFIINAASTSGTTATLNIRRGSSCILQ